MTQVPLFERVASSCFALVNQALTDKSNKTSAEAASANAILSYIDEELADIAQSQPTVARPACRAGCVWCCYLRVDVSPVEVRLIVEVLRQASSADEYAEIVCRVEHADDLIRGLGEHERMASRVASPPLVDGQCSVYAVRPLACRVWNSMDASDCRKAIEHPESNVQVVSNGYYLLVGRAARHGMCEALRPHGIEATTELISGLRAVMTADADDGNERVHLNPSS